MPLALGSAPIANLRLGDIQVQRVYLGTVLAWQYATTQTWTRSPGGITVVAASGSWSVVAPSAQTWIRSVGSVTVRGISGTLIQPQVWLASTTTTILEDGELIYWFGDEVVDGRVGGITVVGVSGAWGASQHQTWTRSLATVGVVGVSGMWVGDVIVVRSLATISVVGVSGIWAAIAHQTWTRSVGSVSVVGASSSWVVAKLWVRSTATIAIGGTSGTWSVVSTAPGVAAFVAIGAKSAGSTTTISIAHPAGTAADQILIAGRCTWRSTSEFDPSDESGWTNSGELAGGTGTAVDAHTTIIRADRLELTGASAGPTVFDQTGTPSTTGGGMGVMVSYRKYSGSWTVATASGDDNNHAANRLVTASTSIAFEPGDALVAIAAVDTDAAMTITAQSLTASGITFGTTTRRTTGAGVGTGNDGNIEVFDAVVTSGSGTVAPTLSFTTVTTQCGPVVFLRLRGGPAVVPSAPTGLIPTAGDGQISLAWTIPASTGGAVITGYVVQKSPDGVSSWTGAGTPASSPHIVTGLTNDVVQHFRVAAVNSVGQGAWSSTVSATPAAGGGGAWSLDFTDDALGISAGWTSRDAFRLGVANFSGTKKACTVDPGDGTYVDWYYTRSRRTTRRCAHRSTRRSAPSSSSASPAPRSSCGTAPTPPMSSRQGIKLVAERHLAGRVRRRA